MKTSKILSVIGSIVSALTLTSCVVDVPVPMGGHGPIIQQGGPPPPGYGYGPQRRYGRPVTPPNTYGDAVGSRVTGFGPPGGYDSNFHYGGW